MNERELLEQMKDSDLVNMLFHANQSQLQTRHRDVLDETLNEQIDAFCDGSDPELKEFLARVGNRVVDMLDHKILVRELDDKQLKGIMRVTVRVAAAGKKKHLTQDEIIDSVMRRASSICNIKVCLALPEKDPTG